MTPSPASRRLPLIVITCLACVLPASAQPDNPVYVDDSPQAWELLQRARDQAALNESEAVRLYQELLDDYGEKLIPLDDGAPDHFVNVRRCVLAELRDNEALLDRYRLMQTGEAQRLLGAGELTRLALTRPLTEPGLEAQLRLGQEGLEAARFHAAATWLEAATEHPDLAGRRAAHAWFMLALVRHYLQRDEAAAAAAARMGELGDEGRPYLDDLTRLIDAGRGPDIQRGATPLDTTPTSNLGELVAQTIWSADLEDSLLSRRHGGSGEGSSLRSETYQRTRRDGTLTTAAAAVTDSVVFINEGRTIRALDRYSGRSTWPRPFTDQPRLPGADSGYATAGDLNLIAVEGEALVTLTGHASATERSGGRVICLESATGRRRWTRSLDGIGDDQEHAGLFPHGRPIITQGSVCMLARKVSRPLLADCYVVALDLESGDLRWIRHIASSGIQNRAPRPFSTLVEDDGDLFVASPVGAVARLDGATGMIRWLVRFPAPMNPRDRPRRPWELTGPLVNDDSVLAITPDERRLVALDRETGAILTSHDAASRETFNAPKYLLGNDRFIYAIGREIRAFRREALNQLAWRLPRPGLRMDGDDVFPGDEFTIAGRVQLVDGALVVPTQSGLLLVGSDSGDIIGHLPIDAPGNPVATGAQLVLSSADSLEVYMSRGRAEQMLQRRIAEAPDDPAPALSLMQLGLRVEDLRLALQAADLAQRALAACPDDRLADASQRELFSLLLEVHRRRLASGAEEGEALYATLQAAARTSDQRVEHLIASGDWLAARSPAQAVDAYQAILADTILAATVRGEGGILRPASFWAASRIGALIDQHGTALFARQAEEAQAALDSILRTEAIDPDALVALAERYPFAGASLEAAERAARFRQERGEEHGALADLSAIYHLAPRPLRARRLLGPFIELCLTQGHTGQARLILKYIITALGDLALDTKQGTRAASAWLADLAADADTARLPRIGDRAGPVEVLAGSVLPRHPAATGPMPPDRILLREGDELRLVTSDALSSLWTRTLDDPAAQLISFGKTELLLWTGGWADDPRIVLLDARTGRQRWITPRLSDHVYAPLARERGVSGRMPGGLPFDSRETLAVLGRESMYLVQRTGGVAAFDRDDGRVPLWARDRTLEEVHLAVAHEFGLVLAGRDRGIDAPGGGELEPRIIVLDPRNGELLHRLRPQGRSGIAWMATDPAGSLLCASAEGIELVDLLRGRRRWMNISSDVMGAPRGLCAGGHVVVERATGGLLALRLEDGVATGPFDVSVPGDWDPMALDALHPRDDSLIAQFRRRIIRYDMAGGVLGADVIIDRRDYRKLLQAEDRLIVISQHESRQVAREEGAGRQTQWTYRIYVLSENGRLRGEVMQIPTLIRRLRDAAIIDGWLLLSTDGQTLALPLAGS